MNLNLIKFLAGILGLAVWAALAFFRLTPVEPLIDLLKMGLGGLIVHMLQGAPGRTIYAVAPPTSSMLASVVGSGGGQGGYASLQMMAVLAAMSLLLAGCTAPMRAWEAAAYSEAKAADDNVLDSLKVAFCAQPLSAFLRNTDMIAGAKALCLPSGNASDPAGLLAGKQPITVNLVLPAPAASAAK